MTLCSEEDDPVNDPNYGEEDPLPTVEKRQRARKDVEASSLPDWVGQYWASRFLPTLYAYVNSAASPFDDLAATSTVMLDKVQSIFKRVYPLVKSYKIDTSNVIFKLVCPLLYCIITSELTAAKGGQTG